MSFDAKFRLHTVECVHKARASAKVPGTQKGTPKGYTTYIASAVVLMNRVTPNE